MLFHDQPLHMDHSTLLWGIYRKILSAQHNIVMDLNNVISIPKLHRIWAAQSCSLMSVEWLSKFEDIIIFTN